MASLPAWIEQALTAAIAACEADGVPFSPMQLATLRRSLVEAQPDATALPASIDGAANPLAELTPEQRQALLQALQQHSLDVETWKTQLLNDWLYGSSSGQWQFIRDEYGLPWLQRLTAAHVAAFLDDPDRPLQVGDRIEVSNGLWEWVQDDGPCAREWVSCVVVAVREITNDGLNTPDSYRQSTTCIVRFAGGREFEIQGIYEWNQYQWRRPDAQPD